MGTLILIGNGLAFVLSIIEEYTLVVKHKKQMEIDQKYSFNLILSSFI